MSWFNQLKPGQVMKELSVSRDPSVAEVVHPEVCNSYSAASLRESYQLRRKKNTVHHMYCLWKLGHEETGWLLLLFCYGVCLVFFPWTNRRQMPMANLLLIACLFDLTYVSFCVITFWISWKEGQDKTGMIVTVLTVRHACVFWADVINKLTNQIKH